MYSAPRKSPKYSVAMIIGYLKGKSAIRIHRESLKHKRDFTNLHFWIRGDCVGTVGLDEEKARKYKSIFVNKKRWAETNKVSSISKLMMNFNLTYCPLIPTANINLLGFDSEIPKRRGEGFKI